MRYIKTFKMQKDDSHKFHEEFRKKGYSENTVVVRTVVGHFVEAFPLINGIA